jgi:light-regulated signal transduction histidine kinase (bacteriophytochrome)
MSVSHRLARPAVGLISCHDRDAKYLPFQTRVACEHLGRLLSLQIQAQEDNAEVAQRLSLHQRVLTLVAQMAGDRRHPAAAGATGDRAAHARRRRGARPWS